MLRQAPIQYHRKYGIAVDRIVGGEPMLTVLS